MRLVSVYDESFACGILYQLLAERDPSINISHAALPTWEDHVGFVASRPYKAWYLIHEVGGFTGSIYLTFDNEIGIFMHPDFAGYGFGKRAVKALMKAHPSDSYLANINPSNETSISFFKGLGFELLQQTYIKRKK